MTIGKTQHFTENGGMYFLDAKEVIPFSDYFKVRVGAVLKSTAVLKSSKFLKTTAVLKPSDTSNLNSTNTSTYNSKTLKTLKTLDFVYSKTVSDDSLVKNRFISINLEENEWIREWHGHPTNLFVNCKTRAYKPFFCTESPKAFDGSVLGLYPTVSAVDRFQSDLGVTVTVNRMVSYLNSIDWREMGLCEAGRYCFTQSSLQGCLLAI